MNYCHIPENVRDVINNSAEGTQQECFDAIAESKDWADAQMNLKNALYQLESECQRIREVLS
jgi:hypothetical protein